MSLNLHNNTIVSLRSNYSTVNLHDNHTIADNDLPHLETSTAAYYLVACILTAILVFGLFFNGTAIIIFAQTKALRTPTNSFVLALCICDMFMCLTGVPISACHSWGQRPIRNRTLCVFDGFMVYFLGQSSMYLLAAISLDRYAVIVRHFNRGVVTQRMASIAIVLCFLLGLLWTVMPLLGWNHYMLEGIGVSCSISWAAGDFGVSSYIISIFVFCLVLPLIVMIVCYGSIYRVIRNMSRTSLVASTMIARNNYRLDRRMVKTIFIMVGAYLMSWTPYSVVCFGEMFYGRPVVQPLMETLPALFAKMSTVWNPVIYIVTNSQFRRAFFEVCLNLSPCTKMCPGNNEPYSDENTPIDLNTTRIVGEQIPMAKVNKQKIASILKLGETQCDHFDTSPGNDNVENPERQLKWVCTGVGGGVHENVSTITPVEHTVLF